MGLHRHWTGLLRYLTMLLVEQVDSNIVQACKAACTVRYRWPLIWPLIIYCGFIWVEPHEIDVIAKPISFFGKTF